MILLAYAYKYKRKKAESGRSKFRRKRKTLEKNKLFLIGVLILAIILASGYFLLVISQDQIVIDPATIITGLSTIGYKQVAVNAAVVENYGIVSLSSECYQVIAYVEKHQAESIIMGLEGTVPPRPGSHDIIADAFENLGIELLMVKVTELRNNTFYGKIILKNGNRIANLDARPSDATAIAVRMNVPIYVKEDLLKTYGDYIC